MLHLAHSPADVETMRRHLPDPDQTPGEIGATVATCGYVGLRTKVAVYRSYGIPLWERYRYVIDRLVPRELYGTNGRTNLWPQPKDEVDAKVVEENRLVGLVFQGRYTMEQAQQQILARWSVG